MLFVPWVRPDSLGSARLALKTSVTAPDVQRCRRNQEQDEPRCVIVEKPAIGLELPSTP
jgi:hypothetical protein